MLNPADFAQFQSQAFKAANAIAAKNFEGLQKLAELNMNMTKTTLENSAEQVRKFLSAKDAAALNEMLTAQAQPNAQFADYAKDALEISKQNNAELTELVDEQFEQSNNQLLEALDAAAKNAPAGSESAFSFLKQSITASRGAYEQAANMSRQFTDMAQANISAAAQSAGDKANKS